MNWIAKLFSPSQVASFGRVGCAVIVTSILIMDMFILYKSDKMPSSPPDIPFGWVSVIGLLWGGCKITEAYLNKQSKQLESEGTNVIPSNNK